MDSPKNPDKDKSERKQIKINLIQNIVIFTNEI